MASVDFHHKCKGGSHAKATLRHNDKEKRREPDVDHANPHLNKSLTYQNRAYYGRSYKEACDRYDKRIHELDSTTNDNTRKDRVTMVGLEVPRPPEMTNRRDQEKWFRRVCDIMTELYGSENVIEGYFHADEIHDYYDPAEGKVKTSVEHIHFDVIPEVDGKLNAKAFCARKNITKINNIIERMTFSEFGCHFHTGTGKRGKEVEQLKMESVVAALEIIELAEQQNEKVKRQAKEFNEMCEGKIADFEKDIADKKAELAVEREKAVQAKKEAKEAEKTLKTQMKALQGISDIEAKLFLTEVERVRPEFAEKVKAKIAPTVQRLENYTKNAEIDLTEDKTNQSRDLGL